MKLPTEVAAALVMAATKHGLAPTLLAGLIQHESGGNPAAIRYEADYRYLWDVRRWAPYRAIGSNGAAPADFPSLSGGVHPQLEWTLQKSSIGPCQVMGAVAREMGFAGYYLTELCEPVVGVNYGARKLAMCLENFGTEDRALSAYNAGTPTDRNAAYVQSVLRYRDRFAQDGF